MTFILIFIIFKEKLSKLKSSSTLDPNLEYLINCKSMKPLYQLKVDILALIIIYYTVYWLKTLREHPRHDRFSKKKRKSLKRQILVLGRSWDIDAIFEFEERSGDIYAIFKFQERPGDIYAIFKF